MAQSIHQIMKYLLANVVIEITEEDLQDAFENQLHDNNGGNKGLCEVILKGDYIARYKNASSHEELSSQVYKPLLEALRNMDPPMR